MNIDIELIDDGKFEEILNREMKRIRQEENIRTRIREGKETGERSVCCSFISKWRRWPRFLNPDTPEIRTYYLVPRLSRF